MTQRAQRSARASGGDSISGSVLEVLLVFLKLGLTSFGGPIAHLGYFRAEFVERRRWLDDREYSDLVALCQFLPGPASSQVGIALGLGRAGWAGSLAAWVGFTLPSALAMILFAQGVARWSTLAGSGVVHGLKVVAVAVVAQAVWGMARSLCPDRPRVAIAILSALLVLVLPGAVGQVGALLLGALAGRWAVPTADPMPAKPIEAGVGRRTGAILLVVFALLLLAALGVSGGSSTLAAMAVFYQAGSLVFGGGHVVLPLLQAGLVPAQWISNDVFLAGYGAAQALPGPLFTFAAYLGAAMSSVLGGWSGGLIALLAVFAPGYLLVVGALPFWATLRRSGSAQRSMAGAQAAVVGVLGAALIDPLWPAAITSGADVGLVIVSFGLLVSGRVSPVIVVMAGAAAGWLIGGGQGIWSG